jgi:probable F420-dependent oxidoreductase
LKIGAVFPTTEIGSDPIAIRDWAQTAEQLGYSHVLCYDHVLGAEHANRKPPLAGPYTENDPFHEPLVLYGYLAGVTRSLELATGVLILPQRQTALVAKQAVEIDLLSGGRLRLGVGTGWNHVEYASLGTDFGDRGARFEEQIELLRRLWREPLVDFEGQHHRIERAGILPCPGREIPIWFGGFTEVAMRRAARLGDGFVFGTNATRTLPMLARLRELLAKEGRDPASFDVEAVVDFSQDPEQWSREIEAWREVDGTHLCLRAMDTAARFVGARTVGFEGPQAYIDALETFKRETGAL